MRRPLPAVLPALLTAVLVASGLLAAGPAPTSAASGVATSAATSAAPRAPLEYVAMGDSYSAASGVLPLDPTAPPQCLRSTRNYPHVVAAATGARLTDVTCGGAQSKHFFESFYPGTPPQLAALSRRTDLVTMTIGGNDNDVFIGAIAACGVAGLTTLGRGAPCREQNGDRFVRDIRTATAPALVKAVRAVRHRAPNARVAVLGYPWIMPPRDGCYPQMPVARGDVPYLRRLQAELNAAVARAARSAGATYVDLARLSEGHDACQRLGVRWVEPVVGTTNPVIVHPNALGERRMAIRTMKVLGLR